MSELKIKREIEMGIMAEVGSVFAHVLYDAIFGIRVSPVNGHL